MADNLQINIPSSSGASIATDEISGVHHQLMKVEFGLNGSTTPVSVVDPFPVTDAAAEASLVSILLKLSADPATQTTLAAILVKLADPATQTTLAAVLAKIIAAPATEAKQDTGNTSLSTIAAKDFATQTTLALIKAKTDNIDVALSTRTKPADTQIVSAASLPLPTGAATSALQTQPGVDIGDVTINNAAGASAVNIQDGGNSITVDGTVAIGAGAAVIGHVIADTGSTTAVTGNVAVTNAGLTNIDVALSTRTKPADQQHTIVDSGTLTAVTAITNALPAGANAIGKLAANDGVDIGDVTINNASGGSAVNIQDGGNSITVDGTVSVSSLPVGLATSANQTTEIASLANLDVALSTRTKPADQQHTIVDSGTLTAVTAITNALPAGSNIIGKIGIDQTTPGTTNGVQVNAALPTGTNTIGNVNQTIAAAGFGKVTDGTNTAAVKAAYQAAGILDPAIVVTPSPNSVAAVNVDSSNVLAQILIELRSITYFLKEGLNVRDQAEEIRRYESANLLTAI